MLKGVMMFIEAVGAPTAAPGKARRRMKRGHGDILGRLEVASNLWASLLSGANLAETFSPACATFCPIRITSTLFDASEAHHRPPLPLLPVPRVQRPVRGWCGEGRGMSSNGLIHYPWCS